MEFYAGFSKQLLEKLVQMHGFTTASDGALVWMASIVQSLVYNLLSNVLHVTNALKDKAVRQSHLEAVLADLKANNIQAGGGNRIVGGHAGTVLPGEYFGSDSGRYFPDVASLEGSASADGMARPALDVKIPSEMIGGAANKTAEHFINKMVVEKIIEQFKVDNKLDFKVTRNACQIMVISVRENLNQLLMACNNFLVKKSIKSNMLNEKLMQRVFKEKENGVKFAHMASVWKNGKPQVK